MNQELKPDKEKVERKNDKTLLPKKRESSKKGLGYINRNPKPIFHFKICKMNIGNISALIAQLQSLGFENEGYSLLKLISFKPENFTLS